MDHDHHHHHDHHDHNVHEVAGSVSSQQDLIMAKVVAMVVLGLVSFVIGVLPVKLASWFRFGDDLLSGKRARAHALVISLLLCFGGGVLLYTTFVHLQPEVRQGFESLRRTGKLPDNDVQLSELVFCAGFFLVYIVEELVHLILDGRASKHDQDKDMDVVHRTMSLRRCPANSGSSVEDGHHHHHSNIGGPNQMIPRAILAPGSPVKPTQLETVSGMTQAPRKSITSSTEGLINGSNLGSTASFPVPDLHHHHNHSHLHHHNHQAGFGVSVGSKPEEKVMSKSISGFLTVLALSFHAVFEGLAVGLESSPNNVWYLFGAVATHKFVIAFCVGIELVTSRTRLSLILTYVATFAAVSPVGIAAGLLLGADPSAGQGVAEVVLQGMAAGTLLYVVFFEILQRERANTQSGVCQLLAIMAGFGAMLALGMTSSHAHSHGGHTEGLDGLEHDDDGATTPAPLAAALHTAEALALKLSR